MKNKGMTLVALIITVVILLIISATVIGLIVGDNSVITNSEIAKYNNSITQIEERLNEIYAENFSEIEDYNVNVPVGTPLTKARALAYYLQNKLGNNNFFRKIRAAGGLYTNHEFASDEFAYVSDEGLIFYFLSPEKLRLYDSRLSILGDMREPDSRTSTNDLNYLYGITGDLHVFAIRENLDMAVGFNKADMIYYDSNSVIYKSGTDWTKVFSTQDDITYQEGQSKKSIRIEFNIISVDDTFDFSGIGELKHLTSLTLVNSKQKSISGIADSAETLAYLWIENPSIEDYSGLEKLTNLQSLYLYNVSQEQLNKILDKMAVANYNKLINFGVIGLGGYSDYAQGFTDERYYTGRNGNVTSIAKFSNLTINTKKAIKNLFLTANKITSLEPLSDFSNLENIRADANNITSLAGLNNKPNLVRVRICYNNLTSLDGLGNNQSLSWLDVRANNQITNISNIVNLPKLSSLYFMSDPSKGRSDSDKNILDSEIIKPANKTVLLKLGNGLQIDPKYRLLLSDKNQTTMLTLNSSLEITDEFFRGLQYYTALEKLSIDNITIKSVSTGKTLTDAETNTLINQVLGSSNLASIRYLQILNMNSKLTSAGFLSNLKNLLELDFRNNNATDLNGLANTTIRKLSINNANINLTTSQMQKVINQLNGSGYWTTGEGLLLCNASLYSQLKNCTSITSLVMNRYWQGQIANPAERVEVDLTGCTKLTNFRSYAICAKYKLPSSVTTVTYSQSNSNGGLDLSRCSKMTRLDINDHLDSSVLEALLKSIPNNNVLNYLRIYGQSAGSPTYSYFSSCNFSHVETLQIAGWNNRKIALNSTECLSNFPAVKDITIYWAPNLTTFTDLSNLKALKSITINNCGLTEIPDVGLEKLKNLTTINFDSNTLTNIYGLIPKGNSDFPVLEYLNLQNNTLEDQFYMGIIAYNIPSKIFVPLHDRKLRRLYLSGNGFTDLSQLKNLSWNGKSGF